MKKNREFPYLAIALLVVWCPLFMAAWNKDKPSSSTSLRNSNPEILANWSALETSFGAHHEFSTGGTNSGDNLRIKFNAPISTPTNAANKLFIYGKDVSAVIEAHILDESGNELQITSAGDLFSSAGLTVTGASTFNGSATLGAGDDLIGSSTSDITFNTNKFTVAGATGNTLVAGTLDVTGNFDPTTFETTNGGFLDEDAMGSDASNKVVSQQSIKKYVDNRALTYNGNDAFPSGTAPASYTDLDIAGDLSLTAQRMQVFLKVTTTTSGGRWFNFRPNGETAVTAANSNAGAGNCNLDVNEVGYVIMMTDTSGIIEWICGTGSTNATVVLLAWQKIN